MRRSIKLFLLSWIVLSGLIQSNAQQFIDSIPGIPLITYFPADYGSAQEMDKLKEMGIDVIKFANVNTTRFNSAKNKTLKIIADQSNDSLIIGYSPHPYATAILKYTQAHYTLWEAEGTQEGKGEATLFFNDQIGQKFYNVGGRASGIVTNSNANYQSTLIDGPGYTQEIYYDPNDTANKKIEYMIDYDLRLERNFAVPDTTNDNPSTPICFLQVTVTGFDNNCFPVDTLFRVNQLLTRIDFSQLSTWIKYTSTYNLAGMDTVFLNSNLINRAGVYPPKTYAKFVEFKIIWLGQNQYKLYSDNITVYDQNGWNIKNQISTKNLILQQDDMAEDYFGDNTGVIVGWNAFDEPETIDNFEPIRIVDSLLNVNSNGYRRLWVSFPSGWNGKWGDCPPKGALNIYKFSEYLARTEGSQIQENHTIYDYPIDSDPGIFRNTDYKIWNLDSTYIPLLRKLRSDIHNTNPDYPKINLTIQCGRTDNAFLREVEPKEINYQTNLGLMFGAKSLTFYTYFDIPNYTGLTALVNINNNPSDPYTDKYYFIKNYIAPRLKDTFGKTLKIITPTEQYTNHQLNTSQGFVHSIVEGNCTALGMQSANEAYDLGFFKDDLDRDYFMLISRWYNPICSPSLAININPLSFPDNYNLKVVNLINNTSTTITKYGNLSTAIEVGDACFFSVAPVVKYGGSITYNDTIKTNTSLIDNMIINNTKTIIINSEKEYTIQDTVTLLGTGFITGDGYVNLTSTGEIIINSWAYSLFKAKSNNHPKLYWGKHPGTLTVSYYSVYRKIGAGNWQFLANTSSRNYTDQSLGIIPPNGQAGTMVYYKLIAVFVNETESTYSNIVQFDCSIKQIEKKIGEEGIIYTYALAQNYPNPFNPSTTINYSLAEDGVVELEILNILGERITTLVSELQTKGNHNINFDASHLSSGIYIYKIQAGDFISSRKMIFLK